MYNIKDIIKGKVKFDGVSDGAIMDEDENHIADARGWSRFQYMENGYKIHDFLAEFIADAINEKLSKPDDMIDGVISTKQSELAVCDKCNDSGLVKDAIYYNLKCDCMEKRKQTEI